MAYARLSLDVALVRLGAIGFKEGEATSIWSHIINIKGIFSHIFLKYSFEYENKLKSLMSNLCICFHITTISAFIESQFEYFIIYINLYISSCIS